MFIETIFKHTGDPVHQPMTQINLELAQGPIMAYSVEKLEKNVRLFFCGKPKQSELHTALSR